MLGVSSFDRARSRHTSRFTVQRASPSAAPTASAPGTISISRLNTRPARAPVNASAAPLRARPHDSGSSWVASPSMRGFFLRYVMPVYPGARAPRVEHSARLARAWSKIAPRDPHVEVEMLAVSRRDLIRGAVPTAAALVTGAPGPDASGDEARAHGRRLPARAHRRPRARCSSSATPWTTSAATRRRQTSGRAGRGTRSRACASSARATASRSTWSSSRSWPRTASTRTRARPSCWGASPSGSRRSTRSAEIIRNCAAAGIPAVKYNLNLLGVLRTAPTEGRGGSQPQHLAARGGEGRAPAHRGRPRDGSRRPGSASRTSSSASCRWPRSTACGSPATRTTPACRPRAFAASRACSAPWTDCGASCRSARARTTA